MEFLTIIRLKWWIFKNKIHGLKKESRLKMAFITIFILFYGIGSFWVLLFGFNYVSKTMGFGYFLIDRLFYVFFMVLFLMLIISQLIITYSSFYRSSEVEYLFSLPVSYKSIYTINFFESTFLSSWAFLFLIIPLFMAYGVGRSLGLGFYVTGICLSIPFIFISAGIGTGLGVFLVRYFPRRFLKILIVSGLITIVFLFIYYKKAKQEINWQTGDIGMVIDQLIQHTKVSLYPLLPSYWVSKGLFSTILGVWADAVFYFLLLLSTALFSVWLCMRIGMNMYFSGWQVLTAGQKTRYYIPKRGIGFLNKSRTFLKVRDKWRFWGLISKDIKIFRRDPVQWSQFVIFFGILGVYILNIRSMKYDIESIFWKNLISYLNIGTITLTLGTLCTRFVYPQMSMECKRMWIIGLTPISIGRVLFIKYFLSVCLCSIVTVGLIVVSNVMLKSYIYMVLLSIGTMFIMSLSLPGLAIGLGSIFPNTKEDDMAKIVAGFGGTLTLVLSLFYIICILTLEIIPVHLYFTKQVIPYSVFLKWMILALFAVICISTLATVVPLVLGYKRLLKMEF